MRGKYKPNCKACQASKKDVKLRNRIRYAAYKREEGDETLADIARDIPVSIKAMYNHVKKHMVDYSEAYAQAKEVKVAKKAIQLRGAVQKELETAIEGDVIDAIEARPAEIIALDDYIAQAKALIDRGELKITATNFLTAAKIRSDWGNKQATNKLDYMKTIYAITSGDKKQIEKESKRDASGTREITAVDSGRQDGPDSLYREVAGAASS